MKGLRNGVIGSPSTLMIKQDEMGLEYKIIVAFDCFVLFWVITFTISKIKKECLELD